MWQLRDQVGLGWRPALAAGILANLDKIDLIEVIADDFFGGATNERRALNPGPRKLKLPCTACRSAWLQ
jgi:hypothetical protein